MKNRLPKFLTPRRKYEVDESMKLVQFGRAQMKTAIRLGQRVVVVSGAIKRDYVPNGQEISMMGQSARAGLGDQLRKPVLYFQWGRMPKAWELSFVSKMKSVESLGIPFPEVLQTDLPLVMGEAPAGVLLRWIGRRARSDPKTFAKAVSGMFGTSGKRIITGLEAALNPEKMLDSHKEPEEPFQSVIDAIQKADAEKSEQEEPMPRKQPHSSHA